MDPDGSLRGYRWPAEWEPHEATWLSWPHNRETWPTSFDAAEAAFVEIARALSAVERLRIGVSPAHRQPVRDRLEGSGIDPKLLDWVSYSTSDAWVRDHGPVFLCAPKGRVALDFVFDNWGQKYPGWELDNAVPAAIAAHLGLPRLEVSFVLEGGSIDGDGQGTILTTESCLLHPNRAPRAVGGSAVQARTRRDCEAGFERYLRAERVVWLAGGIEGDDTDGHIDDVARFVAPGRVVALRSQSRGDLDFAILEENWGRLRVARDASGRRLECVPLPTPPPMVRRGVRLPASYANFYLANGTCLVPVFGVSTDEPALRILEQLLPERRVVPIRCEGLIEGLGAIHCCTKEEPRGVEKRSEEAVEIPPQTSP